MEHMASENNCNSCESPVSCLAGSCSKCSCPHHKAVPVLMIFIALAFLLNAWEVGISDGALSIIWPILLAAIGFTQLSQGRCKCC